jgi:hypothetical protein
LNDWPTCSPATIFGTSDIRLCGQKLPQFHEPIHWQPRICYDCCRTPHRA